MPRRVMSRLGRLACETERKLGHFVLSLLVIVVASSSALAQPEPSPTPAGETRVTGTQAAPEKTPAAEAPEGTEHDEGVLPVIARLVNFLILVGTLVYLLRSPIAGYLNDRGTQIRMLVMPVCGGVNAGFNANSLKPRDDVGGTEAAGRRVIAARPVRAPSWAIT